MTTISLSPEIAADARIKRSSWRRFTGAPPQLPPSACVEHAGERGHLPARDHAFARIGQQRGDLGVRPREDLLPCGDIVIVDRVPLAPRSDALTRAAQDRGIGADAFRDRAVIREASTLCGGALP